MGMIQARDTYCALYFCYCHVHFTSIIRRWILEAGDHCCTLKKLEPSRRPHRTVFSAELTSLFNAVSRSSLLSLALAGRNCCCGHLSPRKPSSTADWFMPGRALSAGSSPTPGRRGGRYRDSKASPGPWRPPEREEAFRSC